MSSPYQVVGLFCEDVREEKNGHTLIGIYPDNMLVNKIPGVLQRLGIYIRVHVSPTAPVGSISSKLRFPDGHEQTLSSFDSNHIRSTLVEALKKGAPHSGFIMMASAGMVKIPSAGRLLAIASIEGEEVICASLNFEMAKDPVADSATAS